VKWIASKVTIGRDKKPKKQHLGEVEADHQPGAWRIANERWPGLSKPSKKYPVGRLQVDPAPNREW